MQWRIRPNDGEDYGEPGEWMEVAPGSVEMEVIISGPYVIEFRETPGDDEMPG